MSAERVMKVLANMPQGLDNTQKAQARDNISCKSRQNPLELTYADYGFVKKLTQDAEGVVNLECSYISAATDSVTGLMSSSDKSKLDGIASGAQVNQNAFSVIKVGNDSIQADTTTDTLGLVAGSNVTLTADTTNDTVTISATDTTYTAGPNIDILNNIVSTEKTVVAAGANISVTSSLDPQTRTVTYTVSGSGSQVNADWDASSGVSQILNKPTLQYKPYGGTAGKLTSLLVDADDPEGIIGISVNGGGMGRLVSGPYLTLLNSGIAGSVGDATHGIYIDSNGQFAQGNAVGTNVETTSSPYTTSTSLSRMTIYDPGNDYGSLVKDQSSNNIGFLLPKHYGQNDLGKVPTVVSDDGYKIEWRDQAGGVPEIEPMTQTTVYVSSSQPESLTMEDGVAYWIETRAGGSFVVHLGTLSTKTIHSKVYLVGTQSNCVTMTIVYEDECGQVQQLNYTYGDTQTDTVYALDVYARKVTINGGGISYDTVMCRVYDYPCQTRDYFSSDNNNIGLVSYYVEPL